MTRQLISAVVTGGVVYPAGTAETEDLAAIIGEQHWTNGPEAEDREPQHPNTALLREFCERLIESHLQDLEADLAGVVSEVVGSFGFDAGETGSESADGEPDTSNPEVPGAISGDYDDHKVGELAGEIDRRNKGRDAPEQIVPGGKNKPDLIAALVADDEN